MIKRLLCVGAVLLLTVLAFVGSSAEAASSDDIRQEIDILEQQQEALEKALAELEGKLDQNLQETAQLVAQKQILDQQVFLLHQNISVQDKQIRAYADLIAEQQITLERAEETLSELNDKYKLRIRAMEEAGELSYWSVLFEASDMMDFLDRLQMIREIASSDQKHLQALSDAARDVEQAQQVLCEEMGALELQNQELIIQQETLAGKQAEASVLLQELLARKDEFETLLQEGESAKDALLEEIAKKETEFDEAEYQEWLASQKPAEPEAGDWITPVKDYYLSSPFGMRMHPILGYMRMHNGVDMACPAGTRIYAARGGQVVIAQWSDSAGNYVQIDHGDGYRSVYMHMTNYIVNAGDYVAPGQLIGYVGNTGLSKGDHLHFGISYQGEYVNPMEYIG